MDKVEYIDSELINGVNLFVYCGNDPINNSDPKGEWFIPPFVVKMAIGAVVNIGITLIKDVLDDRKINTDFRTYLGSAVSGAFSSLGSNPISKALFSGIGDVVGDVITGDITSFDEGVKTFAVSAVTSFVSDGIAEGVQFGLGKAKYKKIIGKSTKKIDINKKLSEANFKTLKIGRDGYDAVIDGIVEETKWIKTIGKISKSASSFIIGGLFG